MTHIKLKSWKPLDEFVCLKIPKERFLGHPVYTNACVEKSKRRLMQQPVCSLTSEKLGSPMPDSRREKFVCVFEFVCVCVSRICECVQNSDNNESADVFISVDDYNIHTNTKSYYLLLFTI